MRKSRRERPCPKDDSRLAARRTRPPRPRAR
jgi:hypothetical protein